MHIWFYLLIGIIIILLLKIIIIKKELNNIINSLDYILKSDTNNLITINYNDKTLKKLIISLNIKLKELRKLTIEYQKGNSELKNIVTNISHDLRTPLTVIRGYLDLMDKTNLNSQEVKYLKVIDNKVNDLILLTDQLFDFSKSIALNNDLKKENICLNNLLEDTIVEFYSLFKKYHINPSINICKEKVIRLLNENMVKRIFENIIFNALKYSEKDFKIYLYSEDIIEFSNKTSKLDKVSLEKIFNRYYTVKNAKKGSGIGLAIAKQLVELMGGKIEAKYLNGIFKIIIYF